MKDATHPEQQRVEMGRAGRNWKAIAALVLSGIVAMVTGAYHLIT